MKNPVAALVRSVVRWLHRVSEEPTLTPEFCPPSQSRDCEGGVTPTYPSRDREGVVVLNPSRAREQAVNPVRRQSSPPSLAGWNALTRPAWGILPA
jgi:hypothetical protein